VVDTLSPAQTETRHRPGRLGTERPEGSSVTDAEGFGALELPSSKQPCVHLLSLSGCGTQYEE